jgi:uncharacterized protein YndB with AHSA1/START domain
MTSRIVVALRISATPEHTFEVFTRDVSLWWKSNQLFQFTPRGHGVPSFEPGVGGRFVETFDDGEVFEIGRITTWEAGRRFAFTWRQASFEAGQLTEVDVRFEAVGDQTRVTVEHRGWETVPQEHMARHTFPDMIFLRRHGEWWQALLTRLAQQTMA